MEMIQNPVLPGFHPDPCLCRRGDDYYMAVSSFEWFPALPVYHSKNLRDWRLLTHAIEQEAVADLRRLPSAKGIWAPCLTWCEEEGLFYMLFSIMNSMNARFFDVDNYLMTAPDITGPWSEPVYLHSAGFDPSILHDEDGKKWVVSLEWETREGYHKPGVICVAEYDAGQKRIVDIPKRVWAGGTRRGCIEGPHLYKRDGWYYLMCAEGGTGYGHSVTMARAKNVFGPYEGDPMNPVLTSTGDFDEMDNDDAWKLNRYNPDSYLQKSGHGSLVETPFGEVYMAHHSSRPFLPELRCTLGREACLQKMEWTKDGWLRLAGGGNRAKGEVPASKLVEKTSPPARATPPPLFGLYTPRIDPHGFTDCSTRPGWLRVRGQESFASMNRASILARKLTSLQTRKEVLMDFEPVYYQAYAGLLLYYDSLNYVVLRKAYKEETEAPVLDLLRVHNGEREYVPGSEVAVKRGKTLRLAVEVQNRATRFYWGYEGGVLQAIGGVFDTSEFSDEYCKSGEFTGAFLGFGSVDALLHRASADIREIEGPEGS